MVKANTSDYERMYGNIPRTEALASMAKCNCTACNSCACGRCSGCISQCTGCKSSSNTFEGSIIEW